MMWLPARLADTWDETRERQFAKADSAHAEFSEEGARTTAPAAPIVLPDAEPRLPLALLNHGFSRHYLISLKRVSLIA
jgi:hypothetical protein